MRASGAHLIFPTPDRREAFERPWWDSDKGSYVRRNQGAAYGAFSQIFRCVGGCDHTCDEFNSEIAAARHTAMTGHVTVRFECQELVPVDLGAHPSDWDDGRGNVAIDDMEGA